MITLEYYGHACFRIISDEDGTWVTDPFDASVGYARRPMAADVVTISHEHGDHNDPSWIRDAEVVKSSLSSVTAGIPLDCVVTAHDAKDGAERGSNRVYIGELEGLRIAHLGDLGHIPTQEQYAQLEDIAVLLIPIGGKFTINAKQAAEITRKINAPITIAMHFNPATGKGLSIIDTADEFLKLTGGRKLDSYSLTIKPEDLSRKAVYALRYK